MALRVSLTATLHMLAGASRLLTWADGIVERFPVAETLGRRRKGHQVRVLASSAGGATATPFRYRALGLRLRAVIQRAVWCAGDGRLASASARWMMACSAPAVAGNP